MLPSRVQSSIAGEVLIQLDECLAAFVDAGAEFVFFARRRKVFIECNPVSPGRLAHCVQAASGQKPTSKNGFPRDGPIKSAKGEKGPIGGNLDGLWMAKGR
jgi:hypothetical protein